MNPSKLLTPAQLEASKVALTAKEEQEVTKIAQKRNIPWQLARYEYVCKQGRLV